MRATPTDLCDHFTVSPIRRAALCLLAALAVTTNAEATMQRSEPTPERTRLVNDLVRVDWSKGRWTVRWPQQRRAGVRSAATELTVGGKPQPVTAPGWECEARTVRVQDGLGKADALRATYTYEGLQVEVTARLVPAQPAVVFSATIRNHTAAAVSLGALDVVACDEVSLGAAGDTPPVVYVDSGGQGGTHMAPLATGQTAAGILAVRSPAPERGLVCAFVSYEHDNRVSLAPGEQGLSLRATTTTPVQVAPGGEHSYDPLLIDCRRSPLEGLEEYATVVRALVQPPIPDTMPMGWLSWYAYRLVMTEDLVLANARVVARHFHKYGVNMIHPDHGWQYKDICGHWIPNEKFAHGMKWLGGQLKRMGMTLALWVAPTTISEFAPLYAEHPEALMQDAQGKPLVIGEKWHWPPHGKTYNVDPLTPGGEQFLRDFGKQMRSYGVVSLKTDFIGGWGGAQRLRRGMRILREALGPDIIIRPCSTALNTQLGVCNEIGIARDIGNAGGNWPHMQVETLELASKWFMHGKFWLNNPDVLIVGDQGETLGEAQGRVTMLALTGGVVFLGDKMPELEQQPERLALVHRCLPSSGQPARPIDLFRIGEPGRDYPRLWHLHAVRPWGEWEVLGVFNWSGEALTETIRRQDLGLGTGEYLVFDFWAGRCLGPLGRQLKVEVAPGSVTCLRIMPRPDRPAVLGTDMHVTQGLVDLDRVRWDGRRLELSGAAIRAPQEQGTVFVSVPEGYTLREGSAGEMVSAGCVRVPVVFDEARAPWSVRFRRR